jgi:hypothetical protein
MEATSAGLISFLHCDHASRISLANESRDLWIYVVDTSQGQIRERLLPFQVDVPSAMWVQEAFPSDRRILATVDPAGRSAYQAIIDVDGSLLAKFDEKSVAISEENRGLQRFRSGFHPESISADGTLVIGTRSIDDGHITYSSELFIGDVGGQCVVPLEGAPQGVDPRFSRQGNWIAFNEPNGNLIHIGRIELVR